MLWPAAHPTNEFAQSSDGLYPFEQTLIDEDQLQRYNKGAYIRFGGDYQNPSHGSIPGWAGSSNNHRFRFESFCLFTGTRCLASLASFIPGLNHVS